MTSSHIYHEGKVPYYLKSPLKTDIPPKIQSFLCLKVQKWLNKFEITPIPHKSALFVAFHAKICIVMD